MNLSQFLEQYNRIAAAKKVSDLLKNTTIVRVPFRKDFIALTLHKTNAIMINTDNEGLINEEYVLLHEYFHLMNNESYPLKANVLQVKDLSGLEWADIFAYTFMMKNNLRDKIPPVISGLLKEKNESLSII